MKASVTDPLGAVEAVPLAGKSMRQGLTKAGLTRDIPMQDRIARRSMLRLIGSGTMLTFALNEAMGNETDMRILVKDKMTGEWRWNSNFMRISAFERDISLFGTYDSLLRLIVMTGSGYEDLENVPNAWRGLAGGVPSQAWEIFTGEDFAGKATGQWMPGDSATLAKIGNFMTSHIPFASQELGTVGSKVWEGAQQQASGEWAPAGNAYTNAAGTLGMEFFGVKSSEYSITDLRRDALKEIREKGIKSPTSPVGEGWEGRYENLSRGEQEIVDKWDPRIQEEIDLYKSERVGPDNAWRKLDEDMKLSEDGVTDALDAGGEASNLGREIREMKSERSQFWKSFINSNEDFAKYLEKEPAHLYDYYGYKYWNIDLDDYKDFETGFIDWSQYNADKQAVLDEAYSVAHIDEKDNMINYITAPASENGNNYRSTSYTDPRIEKVVAQYDRDMELVRSTDNQTRENFRTVIEESINDLAQSGSPEDKEASEKLTQQLADKDAYERLSS